jgi:hypothetical protein
VIQGLAEGAYEVAAERGEPVAVVAGARGVELTVER